MKRRPPFTVVGGGNGDGGAIVFIDPVGLDGKPIPERRWIVGGLLPEGNVTMLSGDGGHGKTLTSLQLAVACALGRPWLGRSVRRCRVLGVFCEDDPGELHRRLADVLRYYGAEFSELEDFSYSSRVDAEDNLLVTFDDRFKAGTPTQLYRRLAYEAETFGAELIILDSLHDFFGGDENQRTHARQFISALRQIAMRQHGAVLLNAHPSMSGRNSGTGEAGSTAWNNSVRSRLYLTTPGDRDSEAPARDYREITTKKSNYAEVGGTIKMRWRDGVFVAEDEPTGIFGAIKRQSAEDTFLSCLRLFEAQGLPASPFKNSQSYGPRRCANTGGHRVRDYERAMDVLLSTGKIRVETGGKRDGGKKIVIVEGDQVQENDAT